MATSSALMATIVILNTPPKKLLITNVFLWITLIIVLITLLITLYNLWIKKEKE